MQVWQLLHGGRIYLAAEGTQLSVADLAKIQIAGGAGLMVSCNDDGYGEELSEDRRADCEPWPGAPPPSGQATCSALLARCLFRHPCSALRTRCLVCRTDVRFHPTAPWDTTATRETNCAMVAHGAGARPPTKPDRSFGAPMIGKLCGLDGFNSSAFSVCCCRTSAC
jgi:hypothetical protein